MNRLSLKVILVTALVTLVDAGNITVSLSPATVQLQTKYSTTATLCLLKELTSPATLIFTYDTGQGIFFSDDRGVVTPLSNITLRIGDSGCKNFSVTGVNPGHVILGINSSSEQFADLSSVYIRVNVVHSSVLITVSAVIGWIYVVAWTLSGYPQVYLNFVRKSLRGFSFDFLWFNLTSFITYSLFNCGLYWIPVVKEEYFAIHPRGINPVQMNDVIFALHAFLQTLFLIGQAFYYDSGDQRVSKTCYIIHGLILLFSVISLVVAALHKITWLTYLYYFSYIKLGVTLIKYTPQVYTIYKMKSTEGFSMLAVGCDFTGGLFSMLQMFVLSYNSDDWGSIIGDPTKFGLGLFSMMFDVIFFSQHFCLYSSRTRQLDERTLIVNEEEVDEENTEKKVM